MVVISKHTIKERIKKEEIVFDPEIDSFQLHNHAVDLRLGFHFAVPKQWEVTEQGREALNIDYHRLSEYDDHSYFSRFELNKGQFFELLPQEYVLASTLEKISIPEDIMAVLYPRSSTNRRGLSVDLTGIIDSGYTGHLVLPILNNTQSQNIKLYPGERICQLVFEELSEPVRDGKKSAYHTDEPLPLWKKQQSEETDYLLSGNIEKLKKQFPLE